MTLLTKEDVVRFVLKNNFRMAKNDHSFFVYLHVASGIRNKITSNQARLFDKLILKFGKQFKSFGYDSRKLIELPWSAKVVVSTKPTISLIDDMLVLGTPYNEKFIQDFYKSKESKYFTWEKSQKIHKGLFSTKTLQFALAVLTKHFNNVTVSPNLEELLNTYVRPFNGDFIWEPTLVKINGNYFVLAVNKILAALLENIELNSDPKTLFKLSTMGIKIHASVTEHNSMLEFAGSVFTSVDNTELEKLVDYIKNSGIELVVLSRGLRVWEDFIYKNLVLKLKEYEIDYETHTSLDFFDCKVKNSAIIYNTGVTKIWDENRYSKYIFLKNSNPIKIV